MKEDQASSTAFSVVQGILYAAQHPKYPDLVSSDMKNACLNILSASKEGQRRIKQLDSLWMRTLAPLMEKLLLPGISLHYVLRKRYIEDYIHQALKEGATQVINLGAGFDTLAYRLASQYPDVNFIEVDHPATYEVKTHAMTTSGGTNDNLHCLPVDFTTQTLEGELSQSSYLMPGRPTICILEGVLVYLNAEQVRQLFESLNRLFHSDMQVIFTAVEPKSIRQYQFGPLLNAYLKIKGESLHWVCAKDCLSNFFKPMGYGLHQLAGRDEYKQRYLPEYPGVVQEVEYIAVVKSLEKTE